MARNRLRLRSAVLLAAVLSMIVAILSAPAAHAAACSGYSTDTTTVPGRTFIVFTTAGSCEWTVPAGVTDISYLVVAGGGGGGANAGGGGGGGSYVKGSDSGVSAGSLTVIVGAGGGASADGGASSLGAHSAAGGRRGVNGAYTTGGDGGASGSKAGGNAPNGVNMAGSAGGGGASPLANGGDAVSYNGGRGANPMTESLNGRSFSFSAGGGGGSYSQTGGTGGSGAGNGGGGSYSPTAASASGAGGGGGSYTSGAAGAAGLVVVSYVPKTPTTTMVTCPTTPLTFTGSAFTPCSAQVSDGGSFTQSLSVSYSANTNAGTATASASFAGDSTYAASSGSANFTIAKATSTTTLTCPASTNGLNVTPCTASATGVGGLSQSVTPSYTGNTAPGMATATASFAGGSNHQASQDSKTFEITDPLTISSHPAAATKVSGDSASFAVAAPNTISGTAIGVLGYQWQKLSGGSWTNISGATSASYSINSVTGSLSGGQYRAKVTATVASTGFVATQYSNPATLTVGAPAPVIVSHPAAITKEVGATAVFTATATSFEGTRSYQWQQLAPGGSWTDIPGATGASHSVTAALAVQDYQYRVVVTNTVTGASPSTDTATSNPATLTVAAPAPTVQVQPQNAPVGAGDPAQFQVQASAVAGTLGYQWQAWDQTAWVDLVGETSTTLQLAPVSVSLTGRQYRVRVTNTLVGASPDVVSVVSAAATLTIGATTPNITGPSSTTKAIGEPAVFSASVPQPAEGVLTYQWQRKSVGGSWTALSGEVSSSLTVSPVSLALQDDQYRVVVTNTLVGGTPSVSTATSTAATLTVTAPPPVITVQPVDEAVAAGGSASFGVSASVIAGTLSYQWQYLDASVWVDLTGETSSSLNVGALSVALNGRQYRVVVANTLAGANPGTVSLPSTAATLSVGAPAPQISAHPVDETQVAGGPVTLTASASSSQGVIGYQWQINSPGGWVDVPGATTSSFTISAVTLAQDGAEFRVVATNTLAGASPATASVASTPAELAVQPPAPAAVITTAPSALTVPAGGSGTVSVAATSSTGTLTYQWQYLDSTGTWVDIAGATQSSYRIDPVDPTMNGRQFRAQLTNTTSSIAATTVFTDPVVLVVTTGVLDAQAPPGGLAPGQSVVTGDGVPVTVTVQPGPAGVGVVLRGPDGFMLALTGLDSRGSRLRTDAAGYLVLQPDGRILAEGTGFAPVAPVLGFIMSTPAALGALTTDHLGSFSGSWTLPSDLEPGEHTVQVNGFTADGQVRSASLGVRVEARRITGTGSGSAGSADGSSAGTDDSAWILAPLPTEPPDTEPAAAAPPAAEPEPGSTPGGGAVAGQPGSDAGASIAAGSGPLWAGSLGLLGLAFGFLLIRRRRRRGDQE